jgi:hypothetical protein
MSCELRTDSPPAAAAGEVLSVVVELGGGFDCYPTPAAVATAVVELVRRLLRSDSTPGLVAGTRRG